jgi:hypothetical protein
MKASASSNTINMGSAQALQALNAGNLKLGNASSPLLGALLANTAFGEEQQLDSERPQILLSCSAPLFKPLVQELLRDCEVGMSRVALPDGRYLAAIIYENATKGVWCFFDPHSALGKKALQDWEQHGNMHITFQTGQAELSMRQPLTNSLIAKLLATPAPQGYQRNLKSDLALMRQMAQAMSKDKPRLFVMMAEGCVFKPQSAAQKH